MSRGENLYYEYDGEKEYCGNSWICDVCGQSYSPGGFMVSPFADGRHICKDCLTEGVVEYFSHNNLPEIINVNDKAYVVHCFEFKQRRKARVPTKLRREILSAGKCNYCGAKDNLQVDHIIPTSKGGANLRENMQCLCGSCNSSKSDKIKNAHLKRLLS